MSTTFAANRAEVRGRKRPHLMLNIISLGAGVQSSTMALMAACGEITPMPDAAIFADTGDEPQSVYEQINYLRDHLPFPIVMVQKGVLSKDFLAALQDPKGRCGQPPFFVRNPDNDGTPSADSGGMLWRQCTQEYKLQPIRKKSRELMLAAGAKRINQWIGISLDEAHRMKPSGVKYIANIYPLVEKRMRRGDCLEWMMAHGYPEPPKSACVYCPYTSNARWLKMREESPKDWALAVEFDNAIRLNRATKVNGAGIKGELFVHRSMVPLSQVDLEPRIRVAETPYDSGQLDMFDMFGNECEGMCGV